MAEPPSGEPALYYCAQCDRQLPGSALRRVAVGTTVVLACPVCGSPPRYTPSTVRRALLPVLLGALRYPFQTSGLFAMGALAAVTYLLGLAPLLGPVLAGGVVAGYVFALVRHAARGGDDFPMPEDFTEKWDLYRSLVRFLGVLTVALAPTLFLLLHPEFLRSTASVVLVVLAGVWAVVYLPAGVILASHREGCSGVLNPLPVVGLIVTIPREYALVTALLAMLAGVAALVALAVGWATETLAAVPVLPGWGSRVVLLVVPTIMARMLGLLLRERATELGLK